MGVYGIAEDIIGVANTGAEVAGAVGVEVLARRTGDAADGDAVPDPGSEGNWSKVTLCWVYKDGCAGRRECGGVRLLDVESLDFFTLSLLEVVMRPSLSLIRRERTGVPDDV